MATRQTSAEAVPFGTDDDWFRAAYPRLRRFAAVVAPSAVAPDDLVQDALVRVLRKGNIYELNDPVAYLCRTMANLASDRRRRSLRGLRARRRLGPQPTEVHNAYPSDLSDLSLLTTRQRAAVYLHDVEGLSFDEVGLLLDCTSVAVRQAAARGRERLRGVMEETR